MNRVLSLIFISIFYIGICTGQTWENRAEFPLELLHHGVGFGYGNFGYIVTGNVNTPTLGSKLFYRYDATLDKWEKLSDFPGTERTYAIGDFHKDKEYLGFGMMLDSIGIKFHNDLWSYDPVVDKWEELASCPCSARMHPAFVALKGKIYVGLGENTNELDDWWEYDIDSNQWNQKADFPSTERHHPYQFAIGDYVYVGFGHKESIYAVYNDWYRYDPKLDKWQQMASLPAQGRVSGTQFSHNGFGYALSGQGEDHSEMPTGEFWKYTPESNSWAQLAPHPRASRFAPSSFIVNEFVYLVAGVFPKDDGKDRVVRYNLNENVKVPIKDYTRSFVSIYPNPFKDVLIVDLGEVKVKNDFRITVYSSSMEEVYNSTVFVNSINLEDLFQGIYFVEVVNGNERSIQKLVSF